MIQIEFGLLAASPPLMIASGIMQHAIYGKWI